MRHSSEARRKKEEEEAAEKAKFDAALLAETEDHDFEAGLRNSGSYWSTLYD